MSQNPITRWKDVAALLAQGWQVQGQAMLVSPTGDTRSAWINAIDSCRKRGLVKANAK